MKARRAPFAVLLLFYLLFVPMVLLTAPFLPVRVATHFNASGAPDAWMTRSAHVTMILAFGIGFPLLLVGICSATRFMPPWMVNIPHRDYWLNPDRRRATADYLTRHAVWLACASVAFVAGIHWLVLDANSRVPPRLSTPGILVLGAFFVVATLLWAIQLLRHFRLRPT